jgi:hypothetical protein
MQNNFEMSELKKQIHCKLTYKDQIRRFLFSGTEFAELRGHICNLLSIPDGFVLKYVDNESDLITLTSTEDLYLALDLSPKILRLVVETTFTSVPPIPDTSSLPPPPITSPFCPANLPSIGNYPSGGCGNYYPHQENRHARMEKAILRIQGKIDYFKSLLAQTPQDDWRRQDLLNQIQRLEARIARMKMWKEKGKNCHKKWKKEQKREEKKEKKTPLSPEALTQIQTLKTQIGTLKPVLYQLKLTKKAKKSELELYLKTGQGDKESLWNEILKLKESILDNKKQISALKDQIHSIRG